MTGKTQDFIPIRRFSSRRKPLSRSFLVERLMQARAYDRIAGYFTSSILEIAGEALDRLEGPVRVVCNSDLDPLDVQTAKAAQQAIRRSWCASQPQRFVEGLAEGRARERFQRLYDFLRVGKMQVRVLPDAAFGLVHGKAGVITLKDGSKLAFLGSANESRAAFEMNYELIWEDASPEGVAWVQDEFDALWQSPYAVPLADFVIEDVGRLAERKRIYSLEEWAAEKKDDYSPDPAPILIETPVYRKEVGLWEHQKHFVKLVFEAHQGPMGKARFILADQVGLGKTLQLAMSALLIALIGERPILVICPKTLVWQWQGEMLELLDMPSAVWNGRQWVDEQGIEYPLIGPEGIQKCPRRVGIVSSGLITRRSEASNYLLARYYDCVILDEAHRARRRNLGEGRDDESPDPNNLLRFMLDLAERTRSLLLATATPVQLRPVEAWDLLNILARGDESVMGNVHSKWRRAGRALGLIMGRNLLPEDETEKWEWVRNPLPPSGEHRDFAVLRDRLEIAKTESVAQGDAITRLLPPDRARLERLFPRFVQEHNPFIRRIVRRTRDQLETQIDPETNESFLNPIEVELYGEGDRDAILLPAYLREAYDLAEEFCSQLSERMTGAGFLKTLLLRRVGSSIYAGLRTAEKMLASWETVDISEDDVETVFDEAEYAETVELSRTLTPRERSILERFVAALAANQERDPKRQVVLDCLVKRRWLDVGCIVFSQYRDSIQWLAEQLTEELPQVPIAVYSGSSSSGIMQGAKWTPKRRNDLKQLVMRGELRLLLGTDAASEGLNLQRLATLINLDLPWNPTRLEQRKGRIQRIGQIHDSVKIYNMRYKDSVEDRVHELLSSRLQEIYTLFGQIPDVLEDAWVAVALGEKERAKKIIDEVPKSHPFEIRYTKVQKIDWESCREVFEAAEKARILKQSW